MKVYNEEGVNPAGMLGTCAHAHSTAHSVRSAGLNTDIALTPPFDGYWIGDLPPRTP